MKTIKGPAIFLGQFAGDAAPFNTWDGITKWAAGKGYVGVQVPTWAGQLMDLKKAAESKDYCDELAGVARSNGVEITELSTHLQGQLVAVHPAYDAQAFDGFAADLEVRGQSEGTPGMGSSNRSSTALKASRNLGHQGCMRPFRARSPGPIPLSRGPQRPGRSRSRTAFDELARRWLPILDVCRRAGRRRLLRDPSGRRPASTA